jgi:aryl sulfotransferase
MGDIYWLASYPKSGNTWFRAFLCNLRADSEQPVPLDDIQTHTIASARGWLDEVLGFDTADLDAAEVERLRPQVYDWAASEPDAEPAYVKIHDALLNTVEGVPLIGTRATRGALYIVRNPLDVAGSAANHWGVDIDEAIRRLNNDDMTLARSRHRLSEQVPQRLLNWSEHVKSWIDNPATDCCLIRYEDMLNLPLETFGKACRFLRLPDDTDRVARAIRHSAFEELSRQEQAHGFKERPTAATRFFRQGRSGGWRAQLSPTQVDAILQCHHVMMKRLGYLGSRGQPL